MKKLSLYIFLTLMFCSIGYAKEENKYYLDHLKSCSSSNVEHYILKDDYSPPNRNRIDIFESTKLNLDCLEKKFEQHLDETIIRKQETVSNGITFEMLDTHASPQQNIIHPFVFVVDLR